VEKVYIPCLEVRRMSAKAFQVRVSGRVTGVGFRWSVLEKAKGYATVSGYVRNAGHGEVEMFVQGDSDEVDGLVSYARSGPPLARVDAISISEAPSDSSIERFEVRY